MDSEFEQITCDILADPLFQETRSFLHHGGENSVYDHSVATARVAFSLAQRFGLSEEGIRSVTRAALLHDFFGYDWHSDWFKGYLRQFSGWQRLRHMHAFIHGDIAAARAQERFGLTERQRAAIASHMFPLAFPCPAPARHGSLRSRTKLWLPVKSLRQWVITRHIFSGRFFRSCSDLSGRSRA